MWPRSGYLNVQLYPPRTIESTSVMHMNFLKSYITEIKKQQVVHNVVSVADPDWSVKGIINLMTFGFLWEFLKLDTLIIQCYAPGHSRFNSIERTWSLLMKCIVSVVLPVQIEELNYVVPKDSEHEKWNVILGKTVEECGKFWHGRFYDGFPVSVQPFLTGNDAIPHFKKTHELLKPFSNARPRQIENSADLRYLQEKYQMFVRHCNRKAYQIEFVRCRDCNYCNNLPLRENDFLTVMRNFGDTLPVPSAQNNSWSTVIDRRKVTFDRQDLLNSVQLDRRNLATYLKILRSLKYCF